MGDSILDSTVVANQSVKDKTKSLTRRMPVRTLEVTKSLRPKEYDRAEAKTWIHKLHKDDEELFLDEAISTLHPQRNAKYVDIHSKIHNQKYERHHYDRYKTVKQLEEEDRLHALEERDMRRLELLESGRLMKETNTKRMDDLTVNWKKTQKVKRDRRIRDLQYEMTVQKVADLKADIKRMNHSIEQKNGITELEKIMKRSGIGAGDGGGRNMTVSYEDKLAYEQRVADMAKNSFPTNEEVSDFKTQLKQRTNEKKAARYEKARRRRRALVEQQAMAANTGANANG